MTEPAELWQGEPHHPSLDEMFSLGEMSREQLRRRRDELAKIVPKRQYGDGTEVFEEFVRPQHCEDPAQAAAAKELYWIRVFLKEIEHTYPNSESTFFANAAAQALTYLRDMGIDYQGERRTIVFWSRSRNRYVQIDLDLYQKLILKGERSVGYRFGRLIRFEPDNPNRDLPGPEHPSITSEQRAQAEAWLKKYPWRSEAYTLAAHYGLEWIEPNTPFWHAATVVMNYERFTLGLERSIREARESPYSPDEVEEALKEMSEFSFAAGLSAAALAKKPLEHDVVAMRRAKSKRAKASGKASSNKRDARVAALWAEIKALARHHPPFSEARMVDQAFEKAVAKDPDLWRQGKGQKEAYLTEIRSREPYKSLYYDIFGKSA